MVPWVWTENSVHIVSFLLKLMGTECHAGAGIRVGKLIFSNFGKLQWLVIWRLAEILAMAHFRDTGSLLIFAIR